MIDRTTTMAASGEIKQQLEIHGVSVTVRHGCIRRDQYDLRVGQPIADEVCEALSLLGTARATGTLLVVEVSGVHQITVAATQGRVVVMPRLTRERDRQHDDMLAIVRLLAGV